MDILYKGPSAGIDFGLKLTGNEQRIAAMAEASAASASFTAGDGSATTINFNASTGMKVGNDGVKFAMFGFGATLGCQGIYSFDTPLGSIRDSGNGEQVHRRNAGGHKTAKYATRA